MDHITHGDRERYLKPDRQHRFREHLEQNRDYEHEYCDHHQKHEEYYQHKKYLRASADDVFCQVADASAFVADRDHKRPEIMYRS